MFYKCIQDGCALNIGHPYELLLDENSLLRKFVEKLTMQEKNYLYQIAKQHEINNQEAEIKKDKIEIDSCFISKTKIKRRVNL
jgi:hypothetical protein